MTENVQRQLDLLPAYFGWHVVLCAIALAAGLAISLPVGVAVANRRRLSQPVLATASIIQTIPGIALLALMYPLLIWVRDHLPAGEGGEPAFQALGFWPTVIALTLYSILPVLRNTVTGLRGIEPAMIEAGRSLGMTRGQMLRRVELPLATPVIIAGLRTATVWTVGVATLSTVIGQTSLGNYIFGGLQTDNITAILFGCFAAAGLAIVVDLLIAGLERSAERRSRRGAAAYVLALLAIVAGGYTSLWAAGELSSEGRGLHVGAKNFTEQFILAGLIAERAEEAGISPTITGSLGSMNAFNALAAGEVDVYVDYSGTIWANAMGRDDFPSRQAVLEEMTRWLREETGVVNLGTLGFENTYALAMRRDHAEALGIETIEDLVPHAPRLTIGSDIEFFKRPEWVRLRDMYGLRFASRVPMTPTLMYRAVANEEVDVITAFSTDGRIAGYDLVVLEDSRQAFPPYDAVLLLSPSASKRAAVQELLAPLVGAIDVEMMRRANQIVDVEGESVEAAVEWLDQAIQGEAARGAARGGAGIQGDTVAAGSGQRPGGVP